MSQFDDMVEACQREQVKKRDAVRHQQAEERAIITKRLEQLRRAFGDGKLDECGWFGYENDKVGYRFALKTRWGSAIINVATEHVSVKRQGDDLYIQKGAKIDMPALLKVCAIHMTQHWYKARLSPKE